MLGRRRDRVDNGELVRHGPSFAKGPNLIVGSVLVAFGLAALLKNSGFPSFSDNFPDGTAQGTTFLGFEVNGWTCWLCIAAGALLLFGAAQHHLAKTMSAIVGLCLGAAAIIALIDGDDVLGLAAANGLTKLGFAVAAIVLLLNVFTPRATRREPVGTTAVVDDDTRRSRFRRDRDADRVPDAVDPHDSRTRVAPGAYEETLDRDADGIPDDREPRRRDDF